MKTIKIIDLLNKIANGEEVPKKIKYLNAIYIYNKETKQYYKFDGFEDTILTKSLRAVLINFDRLNDEVLIIEEKKKLPKKLEEIGIIDYNLGYIDYKNIEVLKKWLNKDIQSILNELDLIVKNQNQLIDYLESKESKGDK